MYTPEQYEYEQEMDKINNPKPKVNKDIQQKSVCCNAEMDKDYREDTGASLDLFCKKCGKWCVPTPSTSESKECGHLKHKSMEYFKDTNPNFNSLRIEGLRAIRCVDCQEDISKLDLIQARNVVAPQDKQDSSDWESRFESMLSGNGVVDTASAIGFIRLLVKEIEATARENLLTELKDADNWREYIKTEIQEERAKLIEMIEGKKYTFKEVDWGDGTKSVEPVEDETKCLEYAKGYNQAKEDIAFLLRSKIIDK